MTTIKQLLAMPVGQKWGGETFTIKTAKKKWEVESAILAPPFGRVWWQQVILMDETGEMPADVKIGKYNPLIAGGQIHIIVSEIQEAEYLGKDRKKLVVDQFSIPTQTADEFQSKQDELDKEVRLIVESKIRCWLVSASIQGREQTKAEILEWQEFVISGE